AATLASLGPLGKFCVDIQATLDLHAKRESTLAGFDLADPIAMAVAIDPGIARFEAHNLDVIDGAGEERGRDQIDWRDELATGGKTRITTQVDRAAFLAMLHSAVTEPK
ncbi:MAG: nucleoside hydrolase, partial [Actinomycetota bacterium]